MATASKLLKSPRYGNLFRDIANRNKRKMPCGDIRVAAQLQGVGLLRLTGKRQDITTSWELTEIGETYVE